MNKFAKNFLIALREAAITNEADLERDAMKQTLDDGTNPEDFDTNMELSPEEAQATDEVADAMSRRNEQIVAELQTWIDQIEEFLSFLNSEDPNSIQSRLAAAVPDTIMDKMKQSQQTKISRVAADLASLHQNFLGFMSQTQNAKFKYVSILLPFAIGALSFFTTGIPLFV